MAIFKVPYYPDYDPISVSDLFRRLRPGLSNDTIEQLISDNAVTIDEVPYRGTCEKAARTDAIWSITFDALEIVPNYPDAPTLARGDSWVMIDKPDGIPGTIYSSHTGERDPDPMHPLKFIADQLGLDRDTFIPLWDYPIRAGGPFILCENSEAREEIAQLFNCGKLLTLWCSISPTLERPQGSFTSKGFYSKGLIIDYAATKISGNLMEAQLIPQFAPFFQTTSHQNPISLLSDALTANETPPLMSVDSLLDIDKQSINQIALLAGGPLRLRLQAIYSSSGESFGELEGYWSIPASSEQPQATSNQLKKGKKPKRARQKGMESNLDQWWPPYPLFPPEVTEKSPDGGLVSQEHKDPPFTIETIPTLTVSPKTLEVMMDEGHPWVLGDRQTGNLTPFSIGELVRLIPPQQKRGNTTPITKKEENLYALIDSTRNNHNNSIVARKWGTTQEEIEDLGEETLLRYYEALSLRQNLLEDSNTDLFRIVHGECDSLPGLYIDRCGPIVRATYYGGCAKNFKEVIYDELIASEPGLMVLEVDHRVDIRQRDKLPKAKVVRGNVRYLNPNASIVGYELGLRYLIEPWEGIDIGFFADQRANRRLLRNYVREGAARWLNLFCHTGAFTVTILAAGGECVSVDLSARYIDWLERNLTLNNLDLSRNICATEDARRYVERTLEAIRKGKEAPFDGIIIDPPTSSTGSDGFWSIRSDYQQLIAQCYQMLSPGGKLLICRNDRKRTTTLEQLTLDASHDTKDKVSIRSVTSAPIDQDYPILEGFPEGTIHQAIWVDLE